MLWPCKAERHKAREIGIGESGDAGSALCPPVNDNLKAKLL